MKKTAVLLMLLTAVALLLSGCAQEQTVYQEAGSAQPTAVRQADIFDAATAAPSVSVSLPEDAAPAAASQSASGSYQASSQQSAASRYAGATPIPLDPVDMPTPTPRPDITFEYETYQTAMGYSLEAPVGWEITQDDKTTFIITDPEERDGVNGQIILTYSQVDSSYRTTQIKTQLAAQLEELKRNYVKWQVWTAAERKLLGYDGYYNTYRGEAYDGTIVRGLVHICLAERRLVTLSMKAPGWYNNSYTRVYNRIKNTIK